MTPEEALAACEESVRRHDPDRYFASLFAPAGRRPLLFALYAFNHEIARAAQRAGEPAIGEIRLQWWREAIADSATGRPRAQPVAIALSELLAYAPCPPEALEALIDARSVELSPAPFSDLAALESHARATAGALMRIAASLLDPKTGASDLAPEAGTAYGLAGILRALPHYASLGKAFLPAASASDAVSTVAEMARVHFARARAMTVSRRAFAAILPAALVPASLAFVLRARRDPVRDARDLSLLRRQVILFRAAVLGKL